MNNEQTTYLVDTKSGFEKPVVRDFGRDGNAFALMAQVVSALERAGHGDVAAEFRTRALSSHSYAEVLNLCADYGELEMEDDDEEEWEEDEDEWDEEEE